MFIYDIFKLYNLYSDAYEGFLIIIKKRTTSELAIICH